MRTIRIYQPGHYGVEDCIELSEEAGQHVGVVLRQKPGDHLILFAGNNREFEVEILSVHKKKVSVRILDERAVNRESPRMIRLVQAISKGERMEWLIQKAVELGVGAIHPLVTQHGAYKMDADRLVKKQQQWQAIAVAACEQCGRNQVPAITMPVHFDQFVQHSYFSAPSIAYVLDPVHGKSWREYKEPSGEIILMIGPEGGFSEEEMVLMNARGCLPLTLGPRVLRTETAAICALTVVQAAWGDL